MNPRMRRLKADFDSVREEFSGHPHLRVDPSGFQRPPEAYRIEYRLRGLRLDGEQPVFVDSHEVELMLPRRYPAVAPYAVPKTPIFHPNIKQYICTADFWAAETTLADVIIKIGDMIQWRLYNPKSPLDPIAGNWATENESKDLLPVGNVDLGLGEVEIGLHGTAGGAGESRSKELPPTSETFPVLAPEEGSDTDDDFIVELK